MSLDIEAKLILKILTLEPVTKEAQPGIWVDVGILDTTTIWIVMQILPDASLIKTQPPDLLHPQALKREMSGTASSCKCSPAKLHAPTDMRNLIEHATSTLQEYASAG